MINFYTKFGVDISRLNKEIRSTLNVVKKFLEAANIKYVFITSTYEGNHSKGSLHYSNDAYDFNTIDIDMHKIDQMVLDGIRIQLGQDFDIVDEANHIHIEYDPK